MISFSVLFSGPAAVLLDIQGISACVDPILYSWLSYSPRTRANPLPQSGSVSCDAAAKDKQIHQRGSLLPPNQTHEESKGK